MRLSARQRRLTKRFGSGRAPHFPRGRMQSVTDFDSHTPKITPEPAQRASECSPKRQPGELVQFTELSPRRVRKKNRRASWAL
jgi:hypothetical protein